MTWKKLTTYLEKTSYLDILCFTPFKRLKIPFCSEAHMTFSQAKPPAPCLGYLWVMAPSIVKYDIPSCKPGFQVRDQYFAELRPKNIFKTLSWTVPSVNWCRISSLFDQTAHPSRRRCGACWSSFFHPLGTPNRSSTHLLKVIVLLIQTLLNPNSAGYRCSGGTFPNAMQIQIPQTEGGNGAPVASQNYPTTWFAVLRIRNPTKISAMKSHPSKCPIKLGKTESSASKDQRTSFQKMAYKFKQPSKAFLE